MIGTIGDEIFFILFMYLHIIDCCGSLKSGASESDRLWEGPEIVQLQNFK